MAGHPEGQRDIGKLNQYKDLSQEERLDRVDDNIQRAKELREEGAYEEAVEVLLEALKLDVDQDRIYYRLGNVYFDSDRLEKAEYAYEKAIELNEEHVNAQHNLAVVYKKRGKIKESVDQRKKAQKVELENPPEKDLTPDQKSAMKKLAFQSVGAVLLLIATIGAFAYLIFLAL